MIAKILIGIFVLGLVLVSGALFLAYQHLHSPEFQDQVVRTAQEVVGSELRLGDLEISLLRGVLLRDLAIANPPGLEGDLLTVEEVQLRYGLFALLSGRIELERFLLFDQQARTAFWEQAHLHEALRRQSPQTVRDLLSGGRPSLSILIESASMAIRGGQPAR